MTTPRELSGRVSSTLRSYLAPFVPGKYVPYRFVGGHIYLNVKESPMMLWRVLGLYEIAKTAAIKRLLRPGDTFVDVGANKGDFTLIAASIVGPHGHVFAFEPEPNNCRWIRESIRLNRYTNIALQEMALGGSDGRAKLYLSRYSGFHTLLPGKLARSRGAIDVDKRTLDSVTHGAGRIDVIKIDVEGAELQVLEGGHDTLVKNEDLLLMIDIHPLLVNPKDVCSFLAKLDFEIHSMRFPFARLTRIGKGLNQILACREGARLQERVSQRPPSA